jgi:hypothetical protein
MELSLILMASLISAVIFDFLPILKITYKLSAFSKESLEVMKSATLTDDEKQKNLLSISGKIFLSTIHLIGLFCIVILPFLLLFIIKNWISTDTFFLERITSLKGVAFSTLGFLLYYAVKKVYGYF